MLALKKYRTKNSKTSKSSGFTLIEVLIALTIIAGAIIIVSSSWSGNFLRLRKSRLNNNVAILLERKMTEMEVKFKDKPLEEVPEEESGDFGKEYSQYRWSFKSQEFTMPDLTGALVSKDGGADETLINMLKQMSEFISKSVKEGTVTVFVKAGKKEAQYSVTTYFVDYNKDLGLAGGGGAGGSGATGSGGVSESGGSGSGGSGSTGGNN